MNCITVPILNTEICQRTHIDKVNSGVTSFLTTRWCYSLYCFWIGFFLKKKVGWKEGGKEGRKEERRREGEREEGRKGGREEGSKEKE